MDAHSPFSFCSILHIYFFFLVERRYVTWNRKKDVEDTFKKIYTHVWIPKKNERKFTHKKNINVCRLIQPTRIYLHMSILLLLGLLLLEKKMCTRIGSYQDWMHTSQRGKKMSVFFSPDNFKVKKGNPLQ